MGLFVQCLLCPVSIHLVSVVFGTAIPTSLNIFEKCFIYFIYILVKCLAFWGERERGLNVYLLGKPHCIILGNVSLLIVYSVELLLMGCKQPSYNK